MPAPAPVHTAFRQRSAVWVRWVLLCFVLALGVAVAAPIVHPQSMELVCTNQGAAKWVLHTDDGVHELSANALHCPLCMLAAPPFDAGTPALAGAALTNKVRERRNPAIAAARQAALKARERWPA
ncbi:hypothetical protein [Variovorax boronicumulans]|uniref:hypothetical protein n=1 Tax=Variovorax boronicumulans TaxID=436515 RepID=UPI001C56E2CF